jgi:fucose 4-O-acetylase-like acetyltransferase
MSDVADPSNTPSIHPRSASRLGWVDYAKGIGIFLVVLGHALRAFPPPGPALSVPIYITLNWSIYAFHMPLFFLLSGLFLHSGATRQAIGLFLRKKVATLLYPYLLWSLIYGSTQAILSPATSPIADLIALIRIPWQPIDHYWFIYAMFIYSVVYVILAKLTRGPWAFLALSIGLYATYLGNMDIPIDILHRMRTNAIYLALGAIIPTMGGLKALEWPDPGANNIRDRQGIFGCASIAITGIVAVVTGVQLHLYDQPNIQPVLALAGIAAIVSLSLLLDRFQWLPRIQQWGKLSLHIYLGHMMAIVAGRLVITKLLGIRDIELEITVMTVTGLYGPIALSWLADRLRIPSLFTWTGFPLRP